VLGLDPSVSRTGYAFMLVRKSEQGTSARWLKVGSLAPEDTSYPVWVRSKAIGFALRDLIQETIQLLAPGDGPDLRHTGLIISFEFPTPENDYLTSLSRILHLMLLDEHTHADIFTKIHVQMTNASTLRSLMGLTKQGAQNKKENIAKAYDYLDQALYPNVDSDACDAVLMAMMGRYSAAIQLGHPENVPDRFLTALCNATQEVVGSVKRPVTRTKGILHRPEYWTLYERREYRVRHCDARVKKARLDRLNFSI